MSAVRVYVSSTWLDLQPERAAVEKAIQRLRETKFVGMEYFGSRDETTRDASVADVERCQIYVGIFAGRYGSGITEAEYCRAREKKLHCLIYFKDATTILPDQRETVAESIPKLAALVAALRRDHLQTEDFTNPHDLAAKVTADLHNTVVEHFLRAGTPTAASLHQLRSAPHTFTGRVRALDDLLARIAPSGGAAAVTGMQGLQGQGGVGKTALALDQLSDRAQAIAHAEAALTIYEEIEDPNVPMVRAALAEWRGE